MDPPRVLRLPPAEAPRVVAVLAEAFGDYPVMRFVLGEAPEARADRLERLVHFFVMARVLRGEPLLGIEGEGGELAGAAIVSDPAQSETPVLLLELRTQLWRSLGAEAKGRYEQYGAATRSLTVDRPHLHLNMIGIRPPFRGVGLARPLVDAVTALSRDDPRSEGVSLTTEDPRNVALYEHLGFEQIGHVQVARGFESWGMFRPDDVGDGTRSEGSASANDPNGRTTGGAQ